MSRRARVELWGASLLASAGLVVSGCGSDLDCEGPDCESVEDPIPCANPQPVVVDGTDTGFVTCDAGWTHRASAVECPSAVPREDFMCRDDFGTCITDADCPQENSHCRADDFEGGCYCATGCRTDADCSQGQICMCGDPIGSCVQAECTDDESCDGDFLCSSYISDPGCGGFGFQCQAPGDECGGDGDCAAGEECTSDGTKRVCKAPECVIGRPFLIDGEERLAEVLSRDDWGSSDLTPKLEGLSDDVRERLATYWTTIARMEHASIAAFARFALHLLALGAPPELVSRTHSAMADETRHARLCFALASGYAGTEMGPGPLQMDGALGDATVENILETVIFEGCLGETVAAMEAKEALEHVTDPALSFVLREIARDESDHAVLAWRTVTWMCETFGERATAVVQKAIGELRTGLTCESGAAADEEALLAHGYVGESVRAELRRAAIERVVLTGLEAALLGEPAPSSVEGGRLTLV